MLHGISLLVLAWGAVLAAGQGVIVDQQSCNNEYITPDVAQQILNEAPAMAANVYYFKDTPIDYWDYRVSETFWAVFGKDHTSRRARKVFDWYSKIVDLKTTVQSSTGVITLKCDENFLQQPGGPETPWINMVTGNVWISDRGFKAPYCKSAELFPDGPRSPSAYLWTEQRYIVICRATFERLRNRNALVIGGNQNGNFTGANLNRAWAVSAIVVHELSHAVSITTNNFYEVQDFAYGWSDVSNLARNDGEKTVYNADSYAYLALSLNFINTDFRTGVGMNYDPGMTIPPKPANSERPFGCWHAIFG